MAGAIGKPPPRLCRGEIPRPQTRFPQRLPPQRELSAARLTEDKPLKLSFIQSAFSNVSSPHSLPAFRRRGGPSAERMVEDPRSLCGNALLNRKTIYRRSSLGKTPHKASPERGGARRRRAEGSSTVLPRCTSTAALSAAVDSSPLQRRTPLLLRRNQARRNNNPKRQPLFGREREGGASLREAASLASPFLPFPSRFCPCEKAGIVAK